MANLEVFLEAERRGILPPEKQAILQEMRARGLVGDAAKPSPIQNGKLTYNPETAGAFTQSTSNAPNPDMLDPIQGDPTMVTPIVDNVIGLDNGVMSPGEKLGTALNMGGESMTLGLVGDEAAAKADQIMGRGTYDDQLAKYRGNEAQFRNENPMLAVASELAPALIPGAGGAALATKAAGAMGKIGAGAALGAGAGSVYGFMEGEGGAANRAANAAITGTLGGLFGAMAPKVIDGMTSLPQAVKNKFIAANRRPTVQALKNVKNTAYNAVDQSGFKFDQQAMDGLYTRVKNEFATNNYVEEVDNASKAVLTTLDRVKGKQVTLSQLDKIRQSFWDRYSGAKDQPRILDAIGAIDDLIASTAQGNELMTAARLANSRYAKTKLLEDAFTKAQDQTASTGSGGNIVNKYRQAVTSIINNEKKARFFSQEEIAVMREFVRGSTSENFKRLVGKMAPSGNGLMQTLQVFGAVASGGATIPSAIVGDLAKRSAEKGAMRNASGVLDMVSGFSSPQAAAPRFSRPATAVATAGTPLLEDQSQAIQNALALRR